MKEFESGQVIDIPAQGCLGLLAAGARGVAAWRRARDGAGVMPAVQFEQPPKRRNTGKPRILLIGWDAADWKLINPLIDAGLMPTMDKLVSGGVVGNLSTIMPPISPVVWTTIATGKTPDQHGVLGFIEPTADSEAVQPVLSTSRKVKAVWNILMHEGLRSCVVGWWPSHPAEPIDGVMVSNLLHQPVGPIKQPWPLPTGAVHPSSLTQALSELRVHPEELTGEHILPFVPKAAQLDQASHPHLSALGTVLAGAASIQAEATYLMETQDWDLMAVYYDAIDHCGHAFMEFHPPRQGNVRADLYELYKDVMTGVYRFHDMLLERLLELAGPETLVVVVSDHGFHPDHLRPSRIPRVPAGPVIQHREQGVICVNGPGIKQDELLFGASVLDVTPTILTALGLPTGRDMRGKPLLQIFEVPPQPGVIESWEERTGACGMHPAAALRDPVAERESLRQLAALGYIDLSDDADSKTGVTLAHQESRFNLALSLMGQRRNLEALPILKGLTEEAPHDLRFPLRYTECCLKSHELEACREALSELKTLMQEKYDEFISQEAQPSAQRVTKAQAAFQRMLPLVDLLEGSLLLAEGDETQALEFLRRAESAPGVGDKALVEIGNVYLRQEKWRQAQHTFARLLDIDSACVPAHHGLAIAHLGMGFPYKAADAALTAIGLRYFNPMAHYHLGDALMRLGDYVRAAESFEVCLSQASGVRKAREHLIRLYREQLDEPDKATAHQAVLESMPVRLAVVSGLR